MRPDEIRAIADEHHEAVRGFFDRQAGELARAAELLTSALARGGTVLLCGNGGSAADAQHIAAELTGRFLRERRGLPAVALTTDTSALTAIGNDYGFERVFARQIEALGRPGDVMVAITTSGSSPNVLRAIDEARARGLAVIGLLGRDGGAARARCDAALVVESEVTARIQEVHILIAHILCEAADRALAGPREG
ncbi:MAG: D-sedoheptulose 7-phosphate isomerase [Acidobacteria bacterium]|jgi:D-sedoheptulose 7-phosphate isomerase|nr:D-sedoheptulose 7-phosphate isomerase [Acidobacteriota bacterium]